MAQLIHGRSVGHHLDILEEVEVGHHLLDLLIEVEIGHLDIEGHPLLMT